MKSLRKEKWTADQVLDALAKRGPLARPAVETLREVRSKVGFGRGPERYADAIAVSVYPSRGLWLAGVEVKVSRQDWLRELRDPEKAEPIARTCDFWWLAAPAGLVEIEEVPIDWGLLEVDDKGRVRVVRQAPRREPSALSLSFVASLLRRAADRERAAEQRGRDLQARDAAASDSAADERAEKLREELREVGLLKRRLEFAERDHAALKAGVAAFEAHTGIRIHEHALPRVGELARFLGRKQASAMAETMRRVAAELEAIEEGSGA